MAKKKEDTPLAERVRRLLFGEHATVVDSNGKPVGKQLGDALDMATRYANRNNRVKNTAKRQGMWS
jgi:hypothetical protein